MRANFEKLDIRFFGESHSEKIGVTISGIPIGTRLSLCYVDSLLKRRKSDGELGTARVESDKPEFLRGLKKVPDGYEVEGEIEAVIFNSNVKGEDYETDVPRPSHADFAAYMRDGKISTGGGRFSGRMTALVCIAGGIAEEILHGEGIELLGYLSSIGGVKLAGFDAHDVTVEDISRVKGARLPLLRREDEEVVKREITAAKEALDSVGGEVDVTVLGLHAGQLGDALFEGLDGKIAYSVFSVPAVKGVEFGDGFELAMSRGSTKNDALAYEKGKVAHLSNHSGGIDGGISNGEALNVRVAIKPTPSIYRPQRSVNLKTGENVELVIKGRHDPCVALRAAAPVEASVALALLDEFLKRK